MKNLIALPLFLLVFNLYGQQEYQRIHHFEYSIVPLIGYNYGHLGYSSQTTETREHSIYLSSFYWLFPANFNLNISYSLNHYLKNKNIYIPLWCRASNTKRNVGFEEGYFPYLFRFSLGSGIGVRHKINDRLSFRSEFGLGATLNLTKSKIGNRFDLRNYSFDQRYPQNYPPIITALRLKLGLAYKIGK